MSETQKTASEVAESFHKQEQPVAASVEELEKCVADCYKQYPREPLRCSAHVRQLMHSVQLPSYVSTVVVQFSGWCCSCSCCSCVSLLWDRVEAVVSGKKVTIFFFNQVFFTLSKSKSHRSML